MDMPAPLLRSYDPARHDSHVVALFEDEARAASARAALLQAGVPAEAVVVMADGAALHGGRRHPVQDLFVPEDDYHDFHHALGRGHALVVVRPAAAATRDVAVSTLESFSPLDLEQHGRHWRGTAAAAEPMTINHATLSRADMQGRAIGGRDDVILDMTGQKMTVRLMSDADMARAPFAPMSLPAERPAPLAPPPPRRDVPVRETSYTYGVPIDVVRRMSPEEQVLAQPHAVEMPGERTARGTFLRLVDGQTCVGWRDPHHPGARVRSYVTERPTASVP